MLHRDRAAVCRTVSLKSRSALLWAAHKLVGRINVTNMGGLKL
nr:L453 [uncultured bacterium]